MLSFLPVLLLLSWAALCALQDAASKRIDNRLMALGALGALLSLLLWQRSLTGAAPLAVLLACALALLLSLPGYLRSRFGAADLKLLLVLALASDSLFLLYSVAGATLAMLLWLALAARLWPHLPAALQQRLRMLQPPAKVLPYAPFLFAGMLLATALS